jgi:hypothetical protein
MRIGAVAAAGGTVDGGMPATAESGTTKDGTMAAGTVFAGMNVSVATFD